MTHSMHYDFQFPRRSNSQAAIKCKYQKKSARIGKKQKCEQNILNDTAEKDEASHDQTLEVVADMKPNEDERDKRHDFLFHLLKIDSVEQFPFDQCYYPTNGFLRRFENSKEEKGGNKSIEIDNMSEPKPPKKKRPYHEDQYQCCSLEHLVYRLRILSRSLGIVDKVTSCT
ncbi:hypothetical protein PIB30_057590 [Stylosanthes scabra]|uniref:Uncharacterized protein n=1 Tax=Stylosanthes scabra TaxID=79078 RepID=A0ABU6TJJ2_9FABA|nr:hypothetical protein [Stylosanthes scabra]